MTEQTLERNQRRHADKPLRSGPYIIQDSDLTKTLALTEWVSEELISEAESWVSTSDLYLRFGSWVRAHPTWTERVVSSPGGFAKRLKQILSARGWPYAFTRQKTRRGISGVRF